MLASLEWSHMVIAMVFPFITPKTCGLNILSSIYHLCQGVPMANFEKLFETDIKWLFENF